jgi:hypothetical protein
LEKSIIWYAEKSVWSKNDNPLVGKGDSCVGVEAWVDVGVEGLLVGAEVGFSSVWVSVGVCVSLCVQADKHNKKMKLIRIMGLNLHMLFVLSLR